MKENNIIIALIVVMAACCVVAYLLGGIESFALVLICSIISVVAGFVANY